MGWNSAPGRGLPAVATAILAAGIVVFMSPASAHAAASARQAPDSVHRVAIEGKEFTALDIRAGLRGQDDRRSAEARRQYLKEASGGGLLIDASQVNVAILGDPGSRGRDVTLVWTSNRVPTSLYVASGGAPDSARGEAYGLITEPTAQSVAPTVSAGSGFGGYVAPLNGMYTTQNWQGCVSLNRAPSYIPVSYDQLHVLTTCYQKFAQSGTNNWVYNRYTNFNMAHPYPGLSSARFIDFTIRSRPWNQDNSAFYNVVNWQPTEPEQSCDNIGTVSVTIEGVGVSVPINQCSNTETLIGEGGNPFHIARDFDGPLSSGSWGMESMTLDMAMAFNATNNVVVPSMADYDWVEIEYCNLSGCGNYEWEYDWDSGW